MHVLKIEGTRVRLDQSFYANDMVFIKERLV